MNINLSFPQLLNGISRFLHRYHVVLFALVVLGGLAIATFMLYTAATSASETTQLPSTSSFDKSTIDKIQNLRSSDESGKPLELPAGRTNPFQ